MGSISSYRLVSVLALAVAAASLPAQASVVIYDNGSPDGVGYWLSDAFPFQIIADDFVLEEGANVITDVHWWGAFSGTPESLDNLQFGLSIFDDLNNAPLISPIVTPDVQLTDIDLTLPSGASMDVYEFDVVLDDPLALTPGQPYFLALVYLAPYDLDWYWAISNEAGSNIIIGENALFPGVGDMAFQLTGVVPEPATVSLLGLGLGGLVLRRIRRK